MTGLGHVSPFGPRGPAHSPPPPSVAPPNTDVAESTQALASALDVPPSEAGSLGPQSILSETAASVRSTDAQIREIHGSIRRDLDTMDALSRQQSALQAIREALQEKTTDAGKAIDLSTLTVRVGTETRSAAALATELGLNLEPKVSQNMLASRIDSLDAQRKNLEGRQESRHLALQDLLHRRSQALELASNLIRSIHETEKALVGNVGR